MKLLLVRHGETDWNLARRYQGQSAVPLNQKGIQQAEQLARRLSGEKIDAIYSSDSPRALETATQVLNLQEQAPALQKDARWQEICFGSWDGLTYEEVEAKWKSEVTAWYADPVNSSPPGGETILQMSKRVQSALNDLKSKHKEETNQGCDKHQGKPEPATCGKPGCDSGGQRSKNNLLDVYISFHFIAKPIFARIGKSINDERRYPASQRSGKHESREQVEGRMKRRVFC